jgi:hypothetical protein
MPLITSTIRRVLIWIGALNQQFGLYGLALSVGLAVLAVVIATGQPQSPEPTRPGLSQLRVDFDPAYFTVTRDNQTGRTTIRLVRPIPDTPAQPPEPVILSCAGTNCPLPPGSIRDIDLYRNGLKMTQGLDYVLNTSSSPATVTLAGEGPAEPWEVITARVYYQ